MRDSILESIFSTVDESRDVMDCKQEHLAMGWVVVIAAERLWTLMPAWGLFWLIAGGLAYTLGAVFFRLERIRYFHFAWHLFVVAGTACHVVAVVAYSG
jgi:hemolysin III